MSSKKDLLRKLECIKKVVDALNTAVGDMNAQATKPIEANRDWVTVNICDSQCNPSKESRAIRSMTGKATCKGCPLGSINSTMNAKFFDPIINQLKVMELIDDDD